jgi:hypothetical protein
VKKNEQVISSYFRFMATFTAGLPLRDGSLRGDIIITSRSPTWKVAPVIPMSPYTDEEARAYVSKTLPTVSSEHVELLCRVLGNHPLALSHACGYLAKTKVHTSRFFLTFRCQFTNIWLFFSFL